MVAINKNRAPRFLSFFFRFKFYSPHIQSDGRKRRTARRTGTERGNTHCAPCASHCTASFCTMHCQLAQALVTYKVVSKAWRKPGLRALMTTRKVLIRTTRAYLPADMDSYTYAHPHVVYKYMHHNIIYVNGFLQACTHWHHFVGQRETILASPPYNNEF